MVNRWWSKCVACLGSVERGRSRYSGVLNYICIMMDDMTEILINTLNSVDRPVPTTTGIFARQAGPACSPKQDLLDFHLAERHIISHGLATGTSP